MPKNPLVLVAVVVILFGGAWALAQWKPGMENVTTRDLAFQCVTHQAVSYHVHPELTIIVNGERQPVPANIGITSACMRAMHTHTPDGIIHIESPNAADFTLGDFFAVWNQPFSATQVLGFTADGTNKVTMTLNGEPVDTFENTIIRDKDQIVITYGP